MQRKKKRSIIFELHSIPIKIRSLWTNTQKYFRKNSLRISKRLCLVSYSIPLSCMVVLLLGGVVAINPPLPLKSNAVTIRDEWVVKDSDESNKNVEVNGLENTSGDSVDVVKETVSQDTTDTADSDYGVMPLADAGITFSISGAARDETIQATPGVVAYREHTVTVNLTNADEYAMFISGNSDITLDTNSAAKLVGMTGSATGSNIPAGQWGYGWDYTGTTSKENLTYQAVPATQKEILTPKINSSTNTVSFTGRLSFAGKFPEGAAYGNYTGGTATLALVVSPKGTTSGALWKKADGSDSNYHSGIDTMQEINTVTRDGGFCKNNTIVQTGWTIELQDNRGSNPVESYKIVKLRDGNCWMQQNLRLKLTKNITIEGSKTDGTAYSWTVPNLDTATTQAYSTSDTWTSDNTVVMSRAGNGTNGTYYTWCAATAGICPSSGVASASICPKGWHLPTGNTNGEFYNLFGANGINLGGTSNNTSTDFQTRFDNVKASPYMFPAAGYVDNYGWLNDEGSYGRYWSSTASSGTSAYYLNFYSGDFYPGTGSVSRFIGFSVRCVANY